MLHEFPQPLISHVIAKVGKLEQSSQKCPHSICLPANRCAPQRQVALDEGTTAICFPPCMDYFHVQHVELLNTASHGGLLVQDCERQLVYASIEMTPWEPLLNEIIYGDAG